MSPAAAIMPPHTGFVPVRNERCLKFLIGYSSTVRRVGSTEGARHRQRFGEPSINSYCPESDVGLLRRGVSRRSEDYATAIRSPAAHAIGPRMIGQPFRVASSGRHNINVGVTRHRRTESDLRTIRREIGINFDALCGSQAARLSAAAPDYPKIAC